MTHKQENRTSNFKVCWQDVDVSIHLSLRGLTQYMQEIAWKHSEDIGFGYEFLSKYQAIWVLGGLEISLKRYPKLEEVFSIETWHRGYEGKIAHREFRFFDQQDQLIGSATSDWFVIDLISRKPIPLHFLDPFLTKTKLEKASKEERIVYDTNKSFPLIRTHQVVISELDFNRHVNTARYFEWTVDSCASQLLQGLAIQKIGVRFMAECHLNDTIEIHGLFEKNTINLYGIRLQDQKMVFASWASFADQESLR